VRLLPVTDGNRTFWHWECRFTTPAGREEELAKMVGEQIYEAGFEADPPARAAGGMRAR
jgi:hypothetical protein